MRREPFREAAEKIFILAANQVERGIDHSNPMKYKYCIIKV